MYEKILNPLTNRYVSIYGKVGKKILKNYLIQCGGSHSRSKYKDKIFKNIKLDGRRLPKKNIPSLQKMTSKIVSKDAISNKNEIVSDILTRIQQEEEINTVSGKDSPGLQRVHLLGSKDSLLNSMQKFPEIIVSWYYNLLINKEPDMIRGKIGAPTGDDGGLQSFLNQLQHKYQIFTNLPASFTVKPGASVNGSWHKSPGFPKAIVPREEDHDIVFTQQELDIVKVWLLLNFDTQGEFYYDAESFQLQLLADMPDDYEEDVWDPVQAARNAVRLYNDKLADHIEEEGIILNVKSNETSIFLNNLGIKLLKYAASKGKVTLDIILETYQDADLNFLGDMYNKSTNYWININSDIKLGDWVYIFPWNYPTRSYKGWHIIEDTNETKNLNTDKVYGCIGGGGNWNVPLHKKAVYKEGWIPNWVKIAIAYNGQKER